MLGGSQPEFPPLLYRGFHPMTVAGLRALTVDKFPTSSTRPKIMAGLELVITQIANINLPLEIWVDGGFLTEKLNPKDSDIVVCVPQSSWRAANQHQLDALGHLRDDDYEKEPYFCDANFFVNHEPGSALATQGEWDRAYWLRQFGFARNDEEKGVAVIKVPLQP